MMSSTLSVATTMTKPAARVHLDYLDSLRGFAALYLVGAGTFAYSLYLIHYPVLQLVWQYLVHPRHLGARTEFALHALIALPCAVGAAYLFFLAFERPFLNTHKEETPAEVARDAALSPAP